MGSGFVSGIVASGNATARIISSRPGLHERTRRVEVPITIVEVPITIEAPDGTAVMAVEYQVPKGWTVTAISDGGVWDDVHRKVKWGPFFENLSRTVTLTVSGATGNRRLDDFSLDGFCGTVSFDGVNRPIAAE